MGRHWFKEKYECSQDHVLTACPGHEIEVNFDHTSSTVAICIDDDPDWRLVLDSNAWDAIVRIVERERENRAGVNA